MTGQSYKHSNRVNANSAAGAILIPGILMGECHNKAWLVEVCWGGGVKWSWRVKGHGVCLCEGVLEMNV